jgi:hypothetical protein
MIEKLKASASTKPKSKMEFAHQSLIATLEERLEGIDKELAVCIRIQCCGPLLSHVTILPIVYVNLHLLFLAPATGTQKSPATQYFPRSS